MSFEGKSQQEIGKWTEYCLKKENGPRASSAPALELNTITFKHVYWYMHQISGERLQDHWSSGFVFYGPSLSKGHFHKALEGFLHQNFLPGLTLTK